MARRLFTALRTLGVAVALAAPVCGHAQTQGFTFAPGVSLLDYPLSNGYGEMGLQFTVASTLGLPPIPVYGLGVYDNFVAHGNPTHGLNQAHDVGIYDLAGNLLVQGNVKTGTASTLVGDFRYTDQLRDSHNQPLTGPFNLTAGSQYIIVAVTTLDTFTYLPGGSASLVPFVPNITFAHSEFSTASTLSFPSLTDGSTGYFGGNFLVTPLNPASSAVPEPGAFALLGGGLTVLGATWRRRRAAKRAA